MNDTILIDQDYLNDCSLAVPSFIGPCPIVWLRHRSGQFSYHTLMADHRTISRQGRTAPRPNHDIGLGRYPHKEGLIRIG